jgi:3-hydroxyisobutyrate dehydrogenase-like beta-hydroxyacid dehydrogenase
MKVAIIAAGNMGAAVGKRLAEHGVHVLTALDGRSASTAARASAAGMTVVPFDRVCEAEFVLSILPPGVALSFAQRLAPVLTAAARKPVFVDCNAVSPDTVRQVGEVVESAGALFVDAAIIGLPPKVGGPSPHFYAAGPSASRFKSLAGYGLDVRILEGPVGAASALKMCYAGINKGVAAIASAMILAATRSGAHKALYQEMSESLPALLNSLGRQVPDMLPKAYRWVAEMQEIAAFAAEDPAAREVFNGFAQLFERISRDVAGGKQESAALVEFFGPGPVDAPMAADEHPSGQR